MRKNQSKLPDKHVGPFYAAGMHKSHEGSMYDIGSPGYRTAGYRSGLGYMETQGELARMQGFMIRSVLTRKFQVTREPTALIGMMFVGTFAAILPCSMLLVVFLLEKSELPMIVLGLASPNYLFGFFAVGCIFASILAWVRRKYRKQSARARP